MYLLGLGIVLLLLKYFEVAPVASWSWWLVLLRGIVANVLTGLGKDLLTLVFLVGLMFWQDWKLAFIAFFAFPISSLRVRMCSGQCTLVGHFGGNTRIAVVVSKSIH